MHTPPPFRTAALTAVLALVAALPLAGQEATQFERLMQQRPTADTAATLQGDRDAVRREFRGTPGLAGASTPQPASGTLSGLRDAAMGIVEGCDYVEYLQLANEAVEAWGLLSEVGSFEPSRDWALPTMDIIQTLFSAGSVFAAQKSAEAEAEGLIYQLEQTCNSVRQADEVNRQHQLLAAGRLNVGNAIDFALDWMGRERADPVSERAVIAAEWTHRYQRSVPPGRASEDTLWSAMNEALQETLETSDQRHAILGDIERRLGEAWVDLLHLATWESSGEGDASSEGWTCPEGYPDPGDPEVTLDAHEGVPICGPASPERSMQVLTRIELLKTEMKALEMDADGRGLEIESMRLMADNHGRRWDAHARSLSAYGQ